MTYDGIRWYTARQKYFLRMLKSFVRTWTHGLYAKHTIGIRWIRKSYARGPLLIGQICSPYVGDRYATHDANHRFNTVSIRTILCFQGHFERMKISLWIFIRYSYVFLVSNSVTRLWKPYTFRCTNLCAIWQHVVTTDDVHLISYSRPLRITVNRVVISDNLG